MSENWKYDYSLLLLSIVWIPVFSFLIQLHPGFSTVGDDGSYLLAAKKLYSDHLPDDARPMLISAIHGLPFLFGFSDDAVIRWGIALNFLSWIVSIQLLFRIVSNSMNRRYGFYSALAFTFCIGNLAVAFNFLSEPVFITFILLSLYFLSDFYKTGNHRYITLSVSTLLFSALVKPVALGLVLIVGLFFVRKRKSILWNKASGFLAIAVGCVFFNMYSLKKNYGDFTLSYIDSITYYNYWGAKADCYRKGIEYYPGKNDRALEFYKLTSHQQKKVAWEDFKEQIRNNTGNLAKAYLFCIYSNTHKGSFIVSECTNENGTQYFEICHFLMKAISKMQNILLTIIGISLAFYTLLRRKPDGFQSVNALFILYIFFISATSCFQCDRFHIVFFPMVIFLIAGLIYKRNKKTTVSDG